MSQWNRVYPLKPLHNTLTLNQTEGIRIPPHDSQPSASMPARSYGIQRRSPPGWEQLAGPEFEQLGSMSSFRK
jgi:hypothetical protein